MNAKTTTVKSLFEYLDYRVYLKDFYAAQKLQNSSYSYRVFAKRAMLASPNYLKLVIDGTRRITDKNLSSFIRGLRLTPSEAEYFRNLVYQREASDADAQAAFKRESERLRDLFFKRAKEIHQNKNEILKSWRHWAIREMVLLKDFRADPKWIAARLKPKVTPAQAQESLPLLEQLEFIKKLDAGRRISGPWAPGRE